MKTVHRLHVTQWHFSAFIPKSSCDPRFRIILLVKKSVWAAQVKCRVSLPLSHRKIFVNSRSAEGDQWQLRRVDEHLYNMYKTLQKLLNAFFLQFLAFFASRFSYILANEKKGLDCKDYYILLVGISHHLNHTVRSWDIKT